MNEKLILTAFRRALQTLEDAVAKPKDEFIRDATIKRFEYTYELAWKLIKRALELSAETDFSALSRRDLFREAAKRGLIDDPLVWFEYTESRNKTSHTYNERVADLVYDEAVEFLVDGKTLLKRLEAFRA
ncbi:nucleotidyltransferase substrate binding protein [soil metagenome]